VVLVVEKPQQDIQTIMLTVILLTGTAYILVRDCPEFEPVRPDQIDFLLRGSNFYGLAKKIKSRDQVVT
jgi:hypothetical protein